MPDLTELLDQLLALADGATPGPGTERRPMIIWRNFVTEDEYVRRAGVADDHCESCHEDARIDDDALIELYSTDPFLDGDEWSQVCCRVANAVAALELEDARG